MELRFLVDDLELALQDQPGRGKDAPTASDPLPTADAGTDSLSGSGGGTHAVQVEVSPITKPGAVVSGKVTFSDGQVAEWFLDQIGQLGLDPVTPGYQPDPDELQSFQDQLQIALRHR